MQGPGKQTALMYSCLKGKSNAVSTLLDAGADVTITEKDGYGPMHGAAFWGQTEVILTLLKRTDIDPLAPHSDGLTPMHRACRGGYMGTVMAFLEAGVEPQEQVRRRLLRDHGEHGHQGPARALRGAHRR